MKGAETTGEMTLLIISKDPKLKKSNINHQD